MYFFDKKTSYLIWSMQEGQVRGIGTVKFLVVDEICRIEISITSCGKVQGTYPVYLLSGGMKSLLGEMSLDKGKGSLYLKCNTNNLGHKGFPYQQVTGLQIDLKTEGTLEQKWLPILREREVENKVVPERVKPKVQEKKSQEDHREVVQEQNADVWDKNCQEVVQEQNLEVPEKICQEEVQEQSREKPEESGRKARDEVKPPERQTMELYANKWKQLCAIYPVVHPFQDGRAYLSIEPRDFVVLQERYQPMVQNSFLLHGFYHYRHLLLGRMKQGQNVQYYLGVPGVFYEKEKAAALFYGFESFEGAVTPSKEGSFGYYMKRVQI